MKPLTMLALTSLGACAANAAGSSLIGAGLDEVRTRYGPPVECTSWGGDTFTWAYRNAEGQVVSRAVTSIDEVVIAALEDLQPNPVDDENRWLGARIDEVLAALGPGEVVSRSQNGVRVRFSDQLFDVVDGRIAARSR